MLASLNVSAIFGTEGCAARGKKKSNNGSRRGKSLAGVCGMGAKGSPYSEDVMKPEEAALAESSESASEDIIEISGAIKWFDAAKGYGFIVPDNGMDDILLHVTVLRRDGHQTAYEGAWSARFSNSRKASRPFESLKWTKARPFIPLSCRSERMLRWFRKVILKSRK